MAAITSNPWGGSGVTSVTPAFAPGYAGVYSTPVPSYPAGARLSSVSVQGFRAAKLLTRPGFLREIDGYAEEFDTETGAQRIVRTFDCPWSGRRTAVDYFLGASYAVPTVGTFYDPFGNTFPFTTLTGGASITRILPDQVPTHPHLWASRVSVEGKGAIGQDPFALVDGALAPMIAYYEQTGDEPIDGVARLKVEYTPRPYELLTDNEAAATGVGELSRYVDRQISYAVQAQQVPSTITFKFLSTAAVPTSLQGQTVPGNPRILIPQKQLQYRWVDVPDLNQTAIDACVGRVNSTAFDGAPGWPSYAADTLLCQPPKTRRYRTFTGRTLWEITFVFDFLSTGWNSFAASTSSGIQFYPAGIDGNANRPLYQRAEFANLFSLSST